MDYQRTNEKNFKRFRKMKIAAIIQARMASTRLPGKVLMKIAGKPMLWHVVERIKTAKTLDSVIVATTINSEDNAIEKLAQKEGWLLYRGSSEDVLDRYYQAAKKFNINIIFRGSSDLPLIDPVVIDMCVKKLLSGKYDYISNFFQEEQDKSDFPRGLDVRVFSFAALEKAHHNATQSYEREHVAPYIWENKKKEFKIGPAVEAPPEYSRNYRLTVDYPEDFSLMEKIYQIFYKPSKIIDTSKIIAFLDKHPEIAQINANCQQKPFK